MRASGDEVEGEDDGENVRIQSMLKKEQKKRAQADEQPTDQRRDRMNAPLSGAKRAAQSVRD